jgi:hypothetical protein
MDALLYSTAYISESDGSSDLYVVRASHPIWKRCMDQNQEATRVFIRIHHPQKDSSFIAALGDPVLNDDGKNLYLPMWMIESNQYLGDGEEVAIEAFDESLLPKAERIVIRPIDSAFLDTDVVGTLEKVFSRMGVLQQGREILIPVEELGGMLISVYIERTEPGPEVFLDGDDIPLEFEQAVDAVPSPIPSPILRPLTPIPPPVESFEFPMNEGMISSIGVASGFVAFQGVGNRLGSD